MNKFVKKIVVLMAAFSLLVVGMGASGGAEVQAASTPAKVVIKTAKANSSHSKITVSWKNVKNATGYQIIYRKSTSSECKKVSVRGKNSRTLTFNTRQAACRLKVRAFRQVKVKGKTKTYYGKWSEVKVIKKYTPPQSGADYRGGTQGTNGNSHTSGGGASAETGNVWIPSSGKKYHSRSTCSGMKNPTQVTQSYAESMGYTPCKKCY